MVQSHTSCMSTQAEHHVQNQHIGDVVHTASEEMSLLGDTELAATTAAGRLG